MVVTCAPNPRLQALLSAHPRVSQVSTEIGPPLSWVQGTWHRTIHQGRFDLPLSGLTELIDNNPLVCADQAAVPDAASTLALIALGPLVRAGILVEPAAVVLNFASEQPVIEGFLAAAGWPSGCMLHVEHRDLGSVLAGQIMAAIQNPDSFEEIDALYDEAFGRSFFVRRHEEGEWAPELVQNKAFACYRLSITPGEGQSLLSIKVLADAEGKCGAAQVVHLFNVMNGFEESLGIED